MKPDLISDVIKMYDQTFEFLEGEGIADCLQDPGPARSDYEKTFRTGPEKYLIKDNLLLLLKDI